MRVWPIALPAILLVMAVLFGSRATAQDNADIEPEVRIQGSSERVSYNEQKQLGVEEGRKRMEALFERKSVSQRDRKRLTFVVHKAQRRMDLFAGETLLKTYRVALGGNPAGHKQRRGDLKTPEGEYYIQSRNWNSNFHLFLHVSYPNADDARAGRGKGIVSRRARDAILQAHRARRPTPQGTRLGGQIGIHGGGSLYDWTLGCIAVTNDEIEEIVAIVHRGAVVKILP